MKSPQFRKDLYGNDPKPYCPFLCKTKDGSRTITVRMVFILLLLSIILALIKLQNLGIWSHLCLLEMMGWISIRLGLVHHFHTIAVAIKAKDLCKLISITIPPFWQSCNGNEYSSISILSSDVGGSQIWPVLISQKFNKHSIDSTKFPNCHFAGWTEYFSRVIGSVGLCWELSFSHSARTGSFIRMGNCFSLALSIEPLEALLTI